ncbi:MAG TPA: AEC family transporter [Ramlibacter sp.]|nr:AEC family transporter [Ramlibacter sp.]
MLQILTVTFPFFALVLLGWAVTRLRWVPLEAAAGMSRFVLYFALPAMLYKFAATTPLVRLLDADVGATWVICAVSMVAVTLAALRRGGVSWNDASFGALVAAFPNSGFMGVPLLVALLGAHAAGPAIVALAIDMVFTSSLCIALSRLDGAGSEGLRRAGWEAFKGTAMNPLPWAILLGTWSAATGARPWEPLDNVLTMLANAASPVALFTLGAMLAKPLAPTSAPERAGVSSGVLAMTAFKLLLHPLLVYAVGRAGIALGLPLEESALTVLVLAAALPSASNVPIVAERFGADAARVARVVLLTTAAAFGTFSVGVALLK